MKGNTVFLLLVTLVVITILGFFCLPSPLYAFGAASIMHALFTALATDNVILDYILFGYMAVFPVWLIVSCVVSFRGKNKAAFVALTADIFVSLLFFVMTGISSANQGDIVGFVIRLMLFGTCLLYREEKDLSVAVKTSDAE